MLKAVDGIAETLSGGNVVAKDAVLADSRQVTFGVFLMNIELVDEPAHWIQRGLRREVSWGRFVRTSGVSLGVTSTQTALPSDRVNSPIGRRLLISWDASRLISRRMGLY